MGPSSEKLVLGLSRAITVKTDVVAHKLESLWEDETLFQTQREAICQTNTELKLHVQQRSVAVETVIHDVVDNYACIGQLINRNPPQCG
jgi:hypothetical protein